MRLSRLACLDYYRPVAHLLAHFRHEWRQRLVPAIFRRDDTEALLTRPVEVLSCVACPAQPDLYLHSKASAERMWQMSTTVTPNAAASRTLDPRQVTCGHAQDPLPSPAHARALPRAMVQVPRPGRRGYSRAGSLPLHGETVCRVRSARRTYRPEHCLCMWEAGRGSLSTIIVVWTAIENAVFFGTRVLLYTSYSRFHRPPFYFPIAASNMCSLMSA